MTAREEKHKCAISNESLNEFLSSAGVWEPGTGALLAADVLGGGWDSKAAVVSLNGALVALVGGWDSNASVVSEAGALVVTVELVSLGKCGALLGGEVRAGSGCVLDSKVHECFIMLKPGLEPHPLNLRVHVPFNRSDEDINDMQFSSR